MVLPLTWLITAKSLMIRKALGSSRKLGGTTEHLIDSSKKLICRLSFEFQSLHAIERHSNLNLLQENTCVFVRVTVNVGSKPS